MLLKGYTSATVDQKTLTENNKHEEDSGTASSNGSNCATRDPDNFSFESNKSLASSEYEATNLGSDSSSEVPYHEDDSHSQTLTDLPPELASMVQDALRQLNENDTETDN